MKYSYKTKVVKDVLTVDVTLSKIKEDAPKFKLDSARILNELKDKYDIVTCLSKITLTSSTQADVVGTSTFKIKPKVTKRPKKPRASAPASETPKKGIDE